MKLNEDDVKLIGGDFLTAGLPSDKAWLARYVNSDLLRRFVVYYVTFRGLGKRVSLRRFSQLFVDHTGHACSFQQLCRVGKRLRHLEEAVTAAEREKDLETISNIKLGLNQVKNSNRV